MTWNDYYVVLFFKVMLFLCHASHIFLRKATNNNSFPHEVLPLFSKFVWLAVEFLFFILRCWFDQSVLELSFTVFCFQNFYRFFDKPNTITLILTEAIFCYKNTTYMASYRWHYETNIILGYYCRKNQDFDMIYDVLNHTLIDLKNFEVLLEKKNNKLNRIDLI